MSGDSYNIRANSWYRNNGASPASPVSPISSILSALAGGISAASGGKATAATLLSNNTLDPAVGNFLSNQTPISTRPKAFLNWILFDEQFKYVSGGFDQVGNDQEFKTHTQTNLPITRNGYLYVYVSNETPNIDVFFDNVQVTHIRGPLTEETHYYPFGGTLSAISSKAAGSLLNRYKYNGKEKQDKEFSDGSGLEWYDYQARGYDPQIGRMNQIDPMAEKFYPATPYSYTVNNPILLNDPNGKDWSINITKDKDGKYNIQITVNAAIVNNSGKKIDMKNYIKTQSEIFSKLFSMDRKEFSVSAKLNMREVKSEDDAKDKEHIVVIDKASKFDKNEGGHSDLGGLRIDLNGDFIKEDGTTPYNATLSHEIG
ncbi:MAG: RHS repeat-associated core domain-containing protein, partial [Sediminibacterium sp.]